MCDGRLELLFHPLRYRADSRMAFFDSFIQESLELRIEKIFRDRGFILRQRGVDLANPHSSYQLLSAVHHLMPSRKNIGEGGGNSGVDSFFHIRFHWSTMALFLALFLRLA